MPDEQEFDGVRSSEPTRPFCLDRYKLCQDAKRGGAISVAHRSSQGSHSGSFVSLDDRGRSPVPAPPFGFITGGLTEADLRNRCGRNRLVFRVIRPSSSRMPMPQA